VLLALALADVAISIAMFAIGKFVLGTVCLFCVVLYGISLMLLSAAFLSIREPDDRPAETASVSGDALAGALLRARLLWVLAGLTLLSLAQGITYKVMSETLAIECRVKIEPLPPTKLKIGARDPEVIVAAFIDPICNACAHDFELLRALPNQLDERIQVWFFHLPRERGACGFSDTEVLAPLRSSSAHNSCVASFAVECMESIRMSTGVEMLALAFAQGASGDLPAFTSRKFAELGRELKVTVDTMNEENALYTCIESNDGLVSATIRAHMRYAARNKLKNTPATFLIPVLDGQLRWDHAEAFQGGGQAEKIKSAIKRVRASARLDVHGV
jgi:hypothetical protein